MIDDTIKKLDTVVLVTEQSDHGLKSGDVGVGDVGVVVVLHAPDGVEIEFVTGSGKIQALLTLSRSDVRPIASDEILSARSIDAA